MQRIVLFIGVLAFLVLGPVAGQAQVIQATVSVEGMSCPFCAFGVEKKLRNVPGVGSVEVDMAQGTATLKAADERFIAVDQVPEAVRRAGFTSGTIEVVAEGTLRIEEDEGPRRVLLVAQDAETTLLLVNLSDAEAERVATLAERGATLRMTGELHLHADELPGLEPDEIEDLESA